MFESLRKIPAMALGTAPISGYSRRRGYQYIWLGAGEGPGRPPILWRVLCRQSAGEGYRDSAGRLFEGRPLLLLSDCLLGDHPVSGQIRQDGYLTFDRQPNPGKASADPASVWRDSDARRWCLKFIKSCLAPGEQEALLSVFKSDPAYRPWRDSYNPSLPPIPAAPDILQGDRAFFLSAEEAERQDYGFRRKRTYTAEQEWWTRSFEQVFIDSVEVSIVLTHFGGLLRSPSAMKFFARPALSLNPSQVLFISGPGGKTRTAPRGAVSLPPVPAMKRKNACWKLTLHDKNRDGFSLGKIRRLGDSLVVPYQNAPVFNLETAPNERISALVLDGRRRLTHYGNIALPLSPEGEARLTLPEWEPGSQLFIFSEQCNGPGRTDYASPLNEAELV